MSLFQKSVLKKYLDELDDNAVRDAYDRFKTFFFDKEIQENIRQSKEEQFQEGFLRELFVNILGYTIKPNPDHNLTTEFKNQTGAKKADGAILINGKALGVIELKSTKTKDLESVRQQAFDYKANHEGCIYVITSNFEKLRFYINNAVEFEEFDLFTLSEEKFKLLYLCLVKDSFLSNTPLKIKEASLLEEEAITKKFYSDYSLFKRELYRDMVKQNMQNAELRELAETSIKKTLFKKSQKLLDRFLFIFFAEDRGLLPPNAISKVLNEWKKLEELDAYIPLYERYKKHFDYLDKGYRGNEYEIFAYNGGLFEPDAILDSLSIDDDLLFRHTSKLTKYNFETDVDVNILGHIFEHSLNEIESVNAEIEGAQFDKQKTKRKKDGIFYTPKYITKYIVDNTIGRLCEEKRKEHGIIEEEYLKGRKGRKKETIKALNEKLKAYRKWLLEITICDPACGSGAFLNQALDYLISEHRCIDELNAKFYGDSLVLPNVEKHILENNIYGVDLNEESIEIAKLSLWLRTAQKGRKLTTLSSNIKCGNSLIDDSAVAGDKAFKWEDEFSEVFAKGGFDVVIGNPPYGAKLSKEELEYEILKYANGGLSKRLSDTYVAFYIVALEILIKHDGIIGYISPNTWRLIESGVDFRKYLFQGLNKITCIVQHLEKVFFDATVDCDIVFATKSSKPLNNIKLVIKERDCEKLVHQIDFNIIKNESFINLHLSREHYKLREKIVSKGSRVSELFEVKNGVKPYEKGKGIPPQTAETLKEKPFTSEEKLSDDFLPLIGGSLFQRYKLLWNNNYWIKYGSWLAAPRNAEIFNAPEKLIFRQTSDKIIGTYIGDGYIMRNNTHILLPKNDSSVQLLFSLGVLNSKLTDFYYWTINPERGEALAEVKAFHLGLLYIPVPSQEIQNEISFKVKAILASNTSCISLINKFESYIRKTLQIELNNKLQNWHKLDFGEFIKELNKAIKKAGGEKLSKKDEIEWMELFEDYKAQAVELQTEIDKTDKEIDRMVYDLYDLTEEEIALVEG